MHEENKEPKKKHKSREITFSMSTTTARMIAAVIIVGAIGFYCKGVFIAAMVNGSPITRLTVIHELEKASGKQALDALVVQKLINAEAAKNGVVVSDSDVSEELAKIEEQLKAQGGTLEQVLAQQGRTMDSVKEQVVLQKKLEKLVSGSVTVTDAEVTQFLKENKVTVPSGQEAKYNELAKDQLMQQKLGVAEKALIDDLKARSKISIFANY